ncbi:MAG: MFS transporter [Actinomycetota bacterium]
MTLADDPTSTDIPRQAWLALGVTVLVTFLVVIDISAVNVAFPSITDDLDTDRATLGWIISGYNVVVGALLLSAGRLADSIGRRRVFIPGVAVFVLGSLLCGLSGSVGQLIAARVVQGIGGAVVLATSFAVTLPEFPATRRSTAIGVAGATGALGAVVGPALGSALISAFSWRAIFLINVPLGLLVVVLAPRFMRESRDPDATGRIDLPGVVIGTASVALVMFAIVRSEEWGLGDPRVWTLAVVGLLLLPVLIRRSARHPEPLLDLDLFRYRSFAAAAVGASFYSLAFTSGALVNSLVLQDLWKQDLAVVGAAFVPGPLLAAVVSPITGSVADRIGHRWVLGAGCLLNAISYGGLMLFVGSEPSVWTRFVPLSLIAGVGIGLTVATWSSAGLSDMTPAKFGVAGATSNTIRQAAYALGISVSIALLATGSAATEITPYRLAWGWITVCYVAAAIAIVVMFPAGNAQSRLGRLGTEGAPPTARPEPS